MSNGNAINARRKGYRHVILTDGFTRRRLLTAAGAAETGLLRVGTARSTVGPSGYSPTRASVDQHPPAGEWFQDAKFGIYFQWGVFNVPRSRTSDTRAQCTSADRPRRSVGGCCCRAKDTG
ncbi:alpha-L-fucosidase [Actinosynnema sp. NPDC050801]|uniref:alpha-L-fucosidase n=1 Tax=unclassified Actinosynnema TaxID=2637065 RepID=UPI0033FA619F